jgi:DDE superfamily endonuclease
LFLQIVFPSAHRNAATTAAATSVYANPTSSQVHQSHGDISIVRRGRLVGQKDNNRNATINNDNSESVNAMGSINSNEPVFFITVDGTHCRVQEPKDESLPMNKKWYSHKFNKAALNYELGLSVYENKLIWMKGPVPASTHDATIFKSELEGLIPRGKKVIADSVYSGCQICETPRVVGNKPEVRELMRRARARHESFNARLKTFNCLSTCFRHKVAKHQSVFEAVAVICQYQLENGSPLFDV